MSRIDRRQLLHGTLATAVLGVSRPARAEVGDAARTAVARAAAAFVSALDAGQRRAAVFPFAQDERMNWHYVPRSRSGVAFKEMSAAGRTAAHELIKVSLSEVGYAKAVNVMKLEEVLRQLETFGGLLRDPEKYYVSVFGTPDAAARWGWRLEGHHLSLNFTLVPDRPVSITPAFFGANPAEVPSGPHRGLRTLAAEQDLAFALARGIDPRLRGRFVIAPESPGDIVSGPGRADSLKTPAGIALGDVGPDQRALALRLVETYARNMRSDVADEELRRMRDAGVETLRFAWAGAIDPRQPHYYRLHGPTLLIEYDNSQNRANHIHSVWHDPRNDFGADVLRAHYESHDHRFAAKEPPWPSTTSKRSRSTSSAPSSTGDRA